jgi:hypothetical protein
VGADRGTTSGVSAGTDFGPCTAFLAGPGEGKGGPGADSTASGKDASTAFTRLVAPHGGSVAATTTYCQGVVAQHGTPAAAAPNGTGKTPGVSNGQSSVATPRAGGSANADNRSGGASAHGPTPSNASGRPNAGGSSNGNHGSSGSHRP